jgi:hypothetical protein
MGWLSKAWKGIKKVVKKIGRGIKKVAKGFMKAIGKLGVVGQLGLMFFMPYAVAGISSMFGNMVGAAGKWLSATAKTLTSGSSFIGKALGHTMNAIHTVGTKIGHVYSTITETISGAVNSFADATGLGKGFDAVGKFFHEKVVNPTKQFFGFETSVYQPMFADTSGTVTDVNVTDTSGTVTDVNVSKATGDTTPYDFSKAPPLSDLEVTGGATFDVKTGQVVDASGKPKVPSLEEQQSLLGKDATLKEKIKKQTIDPLTGKIKKEVEEGLFSGIRQEAREAITGKPPTPTYFGGSRYNFGDTNWLDPNQVSTWNGLFQTDQGNPWMAYSQQFYNDLQTNINSSLQDDVYNREIASANKYARQHQQYEPQPYGMN